MSKRQLAAGKIPAAQIAAQMKQLKVVVRVRVGYAPDEPERIEYTDDLVYVGKTKRLDPAQANDSRIFVRAKSFAKLVRDEGLELLDNTVCCTVFVSANVSEKTLLERFGGVERTLNARGGDVDEDVERGYNHLYVFSARRADGGTAEHVKQLSVRADHPMWPDKGNFLKRLDRFAAGSTYTIVGAPTDVTELKQVPASKETTVPVGRLIDKLDETLLWVDWEEGLSACDRITELLDAYRALHANESALSENEKAAEGGAGE